MSGYGFNRRHLLSGGAFLALGACSAPLFETGGSGTKLPARAKPVPLSDVRLLPSAYRHAEEINARYLLSLEPDRFLHNFRAGAGLKPKAPSYGGWEQDTIAGHSLGHYLSALSLMYAQTGDAALKAKADYIVDELSVVQQAQGDGYVAGFTRKRRDGTIVDGKEIFPEIMAGDIRSAGFDLNGCWVPIYNWHKLFAGLLDTQKWCGNDKALAVAVGLGGYVDKVFAALNDQQVQTVLDCEHGGINESFAELYARTRDVRWLALAERLYHHKVLDPMAAGVDKLAHIHSNTQIPKVIGLARLFELDPKPEYGNAARFFWQTVTHHHSFVIGGNGDREYFFEPDQISKHITESNCEHCASYNMLKLTRHLYAWDPDASYFDYYERTHINHILAQQNGNTGMFTYFTPLFTGAVREFSDAENTFTCCHDTGMESHSKHGDSIYWEGDDTLFVNLYIPSTASWRQAGAKLRLETEYPYKGEVRLTFAEMKRAKRARVALRVPGWASASAVAVNGKIVTAPRLRGYFVLDRVWKAGDVIDLTLSLDMRFEPTNDNPDVVALMRGPMLLAADLGAKDTPYDATEPALVGSDLVAGLAPQDADQGRFVTRGIGRPGTLNFVPFYAQYERRSAVYFKRFTEAGWKQEEAAFLAEQARQRDLAARSVDVMHLGEMQAERDHDLQCDVSWPGTYRGRNGREARVGGFMSFQMKVVKNGKAPSGLILMASYWGDDRRGFDILIDGRKLTSVKHDAPHPGEFFDESYPVPHALVAGKTSVTVRLQPQGGRGTGMIFGMHLYMAKPAPAKQAGPDKP